MPNDKQKRADELREAQKRKKSIDPRLKPMPGAEPYKYHDRILVNPRDPGLVQKRA